MSDQEKLTEIDGPMLAAAFPIRHRLEAIAAGDEVARLLAPRQSTVRFSVRVEAETVLIPARLNFVSNELALLENDQAWRFARALHTRSNDGFERQRAARDLLNSMESWAAPFIVALMGEYIVEILEDIADALTPELEQTLGDFIVGNEAFWATTKRRVTSYWNAYHASSCATGPHGSWRRDEYVGFKLTGRLEAAAFGEPQPARR